MLKCSFDELVLVVSTGALVVVEDKDPVAG
jgi:hypothetical protein